MGLAGLGEKAVGSCLRCLDPVFLESVSREYDDGCTDSRSRGLNLARGLQPVQAWHGDIHEHKIRLVLGECS